MLIFFSGGFPETVGNRSLLMVLIYIKFPQVTRVTGRDLEGPVSTFGILRNFSGKSSLSLFS